MRRREFVTLLGSAWLGGRLLRAHSNATRRAISASSWGLLQTTPRAKRTQLLLFGAHALNWKVGNNLRIDWRWGGSDLALLESYATELVALAPDLLVAGSSSIVVGALQRRTSTIPIMFANVTDPVGQGFVGSLAHPGGNITGFSNYDPLMVSKWLGMLTQLTPPVAHVAALYNPATTPYASLLLRAIEQAAPSLAVTVRAAPVKNDAEIDATMAALAREDRGGLLVLPDIFNNQHRDAIIALTVQHHLPAVYPFRFFAAAGGLMSYGIDLIDLFQRSAGYVDRILKGSVPADLPVQAPVNFKLVVNLKTAKALGFTISPTLLGAADEIIE